MFDPMEFVETSPIPESYKVVTTAQGHHSHNTGTIVVLDTRKGENGEECIQRITPETPYSETHGWPNPHFSHAYAINEDMFLVSRANHPRSSRPPPNDRAIYLVDTIGGREFIYEDLAVASVSPIAIRKRKRPPVLSSILPPKPEEYGTVFLQNAYLTRNDPDGIIKPGMIKALRINALGVQPRNIPRTKSINPYAPKNIPNKVLNTIASPPSGLPGRDFKFHAIKSICIHGILSSTNSLRNKAAVIAPPYGVLALLTISAIEDFNKSLYGLYKGKRHSNSSCCLAVSSIEFAKSSSFVKNTGTSVPNATRAAPVRVAKSIRKSGFSATN